MKKVTKIISFRVPIDVYENISKESKEQKLSITDYILKKFNSSLKQERKVAPIDKVFLIETVKKPMRTEFLYFGKNNRHITVFTLIGQVDIYNLEMEFYPAVGSGFYNNGKAFSFQLTQDEFTDILNSILKK